MGKLLIVLLLLAGCSAEPRFTLWRIHDGDAVAQERGLERLVCETLRDRGEAEARRAGDAMAALDREAVRLGVKPGRAVVGPRYRCLRDGEGYE